MSAGVWSLKLRTSKREVCIYRHIDTFKFIFFIRFEVRCDFLLNSMDQLIQKKLLLIAFPVIDHEKNLNSPAMQWMMPILLFQFFVSCMPITWQKLRIYIGGNELTNRTNISCLGTSCYTRIWIIIYILVIDL